MALKIAECFAERAAGHDLGRGLHQPRVQLVEHRHTLSLAHCQTLSRCLLANAMLDGVQVADEAKCLQWSARLVGCFECQLVGVQAERLECLDEVTPGMRPAIQRRDAIGGNDRVVAGIAIGL